MHTVGALWALVPLSLVDGVTLTVVCGLCTALSTPCSPDLCLPAEKSQAVSPSLRSFPASSCLCVQGPLGSPWGALSPLHRMLAVGPAWVCVPMSFHPGWPVVASGNPRIVANIGAGAAGKALPAFLSGVGAP